MDFLEVLSVKDSSYFKRYYYPIKLDRTFKKRDPKRVDIVLKITIATI